MKEGVDKLAPSVYFVTQETHDTISYAPPLMLLTDAMFLRVLYYYYIVNFIIGANIYV